MAVRCALNTRSSYCLRCGVSVVCVPFVSLPATLACEGATEGTRGVYLAVGLLY